MSARTRMLVRVHNGRVNHVAGRALKTLCGKDFASYVHGIPARGARTCERCEEAERDGRS